MASETDIERAIEEIARHTRRCVRETAPPPPFSPEFVENARHDSCSGERMPKAADLRERTEQFAVSVIKFCDGLPTTMAGRRVSQQLIDSATSVAANYRAASRSYTRPLFIAKLAMVAEEADESAFWLRLIARTDLAHENAVQPLLSEASELTAIFTTSLRTARANGIRRKRVQ